MTEEVVVENTEGCRVDRYISEYLELFTRSQIKNRNVTVKINGAEAKLSRKVFSGDFVEINYTEAESIDVYPEEIPLEILFENKDVIVLNKTQGVVVHPAPGNYHKTLVQGLMYYLNDLGRNFPGEAVRPGVVHRLDKDTSGVIIAAKNPGALEFLANQFREKTTEKKYVAIVKGRLKKSSGRIESYITRDRKDRKKFTVSESKGKYACTEYTAVRRMETASLAVLSPKTGRTHQLRVHMLSIGNPIVGDPVYGRTSRSFPGSSLMLHAAKLTILLPGGKEPSTFYAPIPGRFTKFLKYNLNSFDLHPDDIQGYL